MTTEALTPLEIKIGDEKLEVGEDVRKLLRQSQIRALHEGLVAVREAEEAMPAFDDPTVRALIEDLERALNAARKAAAALWYLAPEFDDGEPES